MTNNEHQKTNSNIVVNTKCLDEMPIVLYEPELSQSTLDEPYPQCEQAVFKYFTTAVTNNAHWEDIMLAHKIIKSGTCNRHGCRIPVKSGWHLDKFEELLQGYSDIEVIQLLKYGFPVSWDPTKAKLTPASTNHLGATLFPADIDKYFEKEVRLGATIGPFEIPPFLDKIGISPLSTRPKKDSPERRVILDLSYPFFESVNDGISKENYCGEPINLRYPTIDTLAKRIVQLREQQKDKQHSETILLFKIDLSRYFRQVPICPSDYSLIGMRWRGLLWFDKFLPMGLKSAAYIAQRISNSITHIHVKNGYWVINYLDDFGSAETEDLAWTSFNTLRNTLKEIGAVEAENKAVLPTTRLEFLGTTVDTVKMTIEVSPHRMIELDKELTDWTNKKTATKKQLQSLIGKLNFVTNCVRPGRIFLSRLIQALKQFQDRCKNTVTHEIRKDVQWWKHFLPEYNGVSILWLNDKFTVDKCLVTDACLTAGGAYCENEYIHFKFTEDIIRETEHISQLELFTILIAIKVWSDKLVGKVVKLSTDNEASMWAVNSGKSKDKFMLKCIREIAWISAKKDFLLRLEHLAGSSNTISDSLSRWYSSAEARRKFKQLTGNKWKRKSVSPEMFKFVSNW